MFGDVHVHTSRSLDAATQDARTTPYQAYQFALGKRIALHPWIANSKEGKINVKNTFLKKGESFSKVPTFDAKPTRSIQLGRPLDFTMISDHAEFFGELRDLKKSETGERIALCFLTGDLFVEKLKVFRTLIRV